MTKIEEVAAAVRSVRKLEEIVAHQEETFLEIRDQLSALQTRLTRLEARIPRPAGDP